MWTMFASPLGLLSGRPSASPSETSARSRRMPPESLEALENLTKEGPCQVAFGELQGEVPGMPDEASAVWPWATTALRLAS